MANSLHAGNQATACRGTKRRRLVSSFHLLITGGKGYIGKAVVEAARQKGAHVTQLVRAPSDQNLERQREYAWRIGDWPPDSAMHGDAAFPPVDAVLHLAYDWDTAGDPEHDINVVGTRRLLEAARAANIPRFVLASSVAARPGALNRYGRIKFQVEGLLTGSRAEIAARVGLVYGGDPERLWGTMCRVAGSFPILPMIEVDRPVQPIRLDEVVEGLLRLTLDAGLTRRIYGLANPVPIPFGEFLKLIAHHKYGRRLRLISLPLPFVLMAIDVARWIPALPRIDKERVLGLAGVPVLHTVDDLREIGIILRDPADGLASA